MEKNMAGSYVPIDEIVKLNAQHKQEVCELETEYKTMLAELSQKEEVIYFVDVFPKKKKKCTIRLHVLGRLFSRRTSGNGTRPCRSTDIGTRSKIYSRKSATAIEP